MKPDILEIQPLELKFLFEVKKQSSCSVQMFNRTNQHVAFKIKTTNPKKYCVRPNTGVIDPNASCDFTVTMQAPKVVPPDMTCRDKFLVQSTVVPEGTMEEDVTSSTFAKEDGKIVDEKRLKVAFIPSTDSSESSPVKEPSNPVHNIESREIKDHVVQKDNSHDKIDEGVVEASKGDGQSVKSTKIEETYKKEEAVERVKAPVKQIQEHTKSNEEVVLVNDTEEVTLANDVEDMRLKVRELESKLTEAKATILHLTEEKRSATQEKHFIQGELDLLRSKRHRAQVGFPLLFVFMVSLVSVYLGYLMHS